MLNVIPVSGPTQFHLYQQPPPVVVLKQLKNLYTQEPRKCVNGKERNLCYCEGGKGTAKFSVRGSFMRTGCQTLFAGCVVVLFIHKIVTDPGQIQNLSCPYLRGTHCEGINS